MQRDALGKLTKSTKSTWRGWLWNATIKVLGHPPVMIEFVTRLQKQLETEQTKNQEVKLELENQVKELQEQRLQWQAKEASTRKELQDAQQRTKDLLEQVVQLTHKERQAKQSLFDQQFKTDTTPLERNRFEMELAEARGRMKRAEEKTMLAEKKLAEMELFKKRAAKSKELETEVAWLKKQASIYISALEAAVEKVRQLEDRLSKLKPAKSTRSLRPAHHPYHKPSMRKTRGRVKINTAVADPKCTNNCTANAGGTEKRSVCQT